jgi:ABC-2 type transport system ATP-binding protein
MEAMIEAEGLKKRFGQVEALAGLTLSAPAGGVLAVLGPNGAGKTTFVRTVSTLIRPDAGSLRVAGIDARRRPHDVRARIGLAGQAAAVENALTGFENLEMMARLFGRSRRAARTVARDTLERLGLAEHGDRLVRGWSGGMRRRLDLAASMVGEPQVLLLDEPTTGLDPASRIALWESVRELVARGTSVLLTTQNLDEADQLASRIAIIDHGRVIAEGSPADLKAQTGRAVIDAQPRNRADAPAVATALSTVAVDSPQLDHATGRVTVTVGDDTSVLASVVRILDGAALAIDDLSLRRPTLDEVFLALTGHATNHIEKKAS